MSRKIRRTAGFEEGSVGWWYPTWGLWRSNGNGAADRERIGVMLTYEYSSAPQKKWVGLSWTDSWRLRLRRDMCVYFIFEYRYRSNHGRIVNRQNNNKKNKVSLKIDGRLESPWVVYQNNNKLVRAKVNNKIKTKYKTNGLWMRIIKVST